MERGTTRALTAPAVVIGRCREKTANDCPGFSTSENGTERKSAETLRSRIGPVTESSGGRGGRGAKQRATARGGKPKIHPCRAHAASSPSLSLSARSPREPALLVALRLSARLSLPFFSPYPPLLRICLFLARSARVHPHSLLSLSFSRSFLRRRFRARCFARSLFPSRRFTSPLSLTSCPRLFASALFSSLVSFGVSLLAFSVRSLVFVNSLNLYASSLVFLLCSLRSRIVTPVPSSAFSVITSIHSARSNLLAVFASAASATVRIFVTGRYFSGILLIIIS